MATTATDGSATGRPSNVSARIGRDAPWLLVMAVLALLEFAWWGSAWSNGIAPSPHLVAYLAGAGSAFAVAFGIRAALPRRAKLPSIFSLIAGVVVVALSASLFLPLKVAIPKEVPFWLDPALANLERIAGTDPWKVLNATFGWATPAVDLIYALWLPTQLVVMFTLMLQPASGAKSRALSAYFLSWFLLGVAAAVLLSSAGPIFYDRLYGGSDFSALAETLRARGATFAIAESDAMWSAFANDRPGLVAGISAVPSLHVAISFWIFLAAQSIAPRLKWLALIYFVLVWVASVQLGWHYIADGLVGILGVLAIWALARPLEARLMAALRGPA